jgi:hypothetical protein
MDWLCCLGVSPVLAASLTEDQREVLALDLRGMGEPFNLSHEEFAARMGALTPPPEVSSTLDDIYFAQVAAEEEQALPYDGEAAEDEDEAFETVDLDSGEVLAEVGGFQHPDAAALLGTDEEGEPAGDMVEQFNELTAEDRAEFVLGGAFSRSELDSLFNVEANGRRSKKVLTAITTEIQKLPNPTADSINQALVTASAGPRQPEE